MPTSLLSDVSLLIVDADAAFRRGVAAILEREGCRVFAAARGLSALEVLSEEQIDVALLEVQAPREEGLALLLQVRRRFPEVGVAAMAGAPIQGRRVLDPLQALDMALRMGADRTLLKPFPETELLAVVRGLLGPGRGTGNAPGQEGRRDPGRGSLDDAPAAL